MRTNKLRAFIRYNEKGKIVPGSLIVSRQAPKVGTWLEIRSSKSEDIKYIIITNK